MRGESPVLPRTGEVPGSLPLIGGASALLGLGTFFLWRSRREED
ncbi:LPXTG cell wall anchor domain-containing protein [Brockia lithotrophica]